MKLCAELLQTDMSREHVVLESLTNRDAGTVKNRDKHMHRRQRPIDSVQTAITICGFQSNFFLISLCHYKHCWVQLGRESSFKT